MVEWYIYSTKWDNHIVVTLHFYGYKDIVLLFYYDQDIYLPSVKYKLSFLK